MVLSLLGHTNCIISFSSPPALIIFDPLDLSLFPHMAVTCNFFFCERVRSVANFCSCFHLFFQDASAESDCCYCPASKALAGVPVYHKAFVKGKMWYKLSALGHHLLPGQLSWKAQKGHIPLDSGPDWARIDICRRFLLVLIRCLCLMTPCLTVY